MIRYRNKIGQFAPVTLRARVFIDGQEIFGAAKQQVIRKRQKEIKKAKREKKKRLLKRKRKPKEKIEEVITEKRATHSVPRELPSTFSWFVQNLDTVPNRAKRDIYVLVRLGFGAVSEAETLEDVETAIDEQWIIPVKVAPKYTLKELRSMSEKELKYIVETENKVYPVQEIVSVVAKKDKTHIKRNKRNNPLVRQYLESLKKKEKKQEKTKRREWN